VHKRGLRWPRTFARRGCCPLVGLESLWGGVTSREGDSGLWKQSKGLGSLAYIPNETIEKKRSTEDSWEARSQGGWKGERKSKEDRNALLTEEDGQGIPVVRVRRKGLRERG